MRKLILLAVLICFALCVVPVLPSYAQGKSTVSSAALTDNSVSDKIGDWFATRGKSGAEKQKILAQRKMQRTALRKQKQLEKQKKEADKKMQQQKKNVQKGARNIKKGVPK